MDIWEIMRARHSVRRFLRQPIAAEAVHALQAAAQEASQDSGLRFTLCLNEPNAFQANKPHYGNFCGCENYIAIVGAKGSDEKVGYYGEKLVLLAQQLGLNTCWVALTYEKSAPPVQLAAGEKLFDLIALGYGENQGTPHKNKPMEKLAKLTEQTPEWFLRGMEAAMLAPTAINQQRFHFTQVGERGVKAKALLGPCSKTDLGIVKYHFELGAGKENFDWI